MYAESNGTANRIHITEETRERLDKNKYTFEEKRENLDAKRRGKYKTYYLNSKNGMQTVGSVPGVPVDNNESPIN